MRHIVSVMLGIGTFTALVAACPVASAQPNQENLVGEWTFARAVSKTVFVFDSSGNQNHGLKGHTSSVRTPRGFGLSFDGPKAFVEVPDVDDDLDTNDFSIDVWVQVNTVTQPHGAPFVIKGGNGEEPFSNDNYLLGLLSDGRLVCGYETSAAHADQSAFSAGPIPLGAFVHLACTYESGTGLLKVFQNGVEVGSHLVTASPPQIQDKPLWLGNNRRINNATLDGVLDNVRIWNVALTATDIQTLATQ